MSSYFDQAARMVGWEMTDGNVRRAWDIASIAVNRYGEYIAIMRQRTTTEAESRAINRFYVKWQMVLTSMGEITPDECIQQLHDIAHGLASLRILTTAGARIGDNPYADGGTDDIQKSALAGQPRPVRPAQDTIYTTMAYVVSMTPNAPTPETAECKDCGRRVELAKDGKMVTHGPGRSAFLCSGSGKKPEVGA